MSCLLQDFEEGNGNLPDDGQQVTFDYTAYNESGARIDSTYQKGRPAQTRLGINGLIPGMLLNLFEHTVTNATLLLLQRRKLWHVWLRHVESGVNLAEIAFPCKQDC